MIFFQKNRIIVLGALFGTISLRLNLKYRQIEDMLLQWNQCLDKSFDVVFMGSSMGGFASEYLAMKTGCKAIMINPAITRGELLPQFIGVTENYETAQPYSWNQEHCNQYGKYEQEFINSKQCIDRTILLDMAGELIDSENSLLKYKDKANVVTYAGGSHSFEHIRRALAVIERVIFS
ncbi:MAG: hypothetical protein HOE45_04865 [Gammaproteobacteria bacterium]|nr:hypothetical protein [Gammaproteobacteria bacterium]